VVVATQVWELSPAQIAAEYDLTEAQVKDALAFYEAHRQEIDAGIGRVSCLNHRGKPAWTHRDDSDLALPLFEERGHNSSAKE